MEKMNIPEDRRMTIEEFYSLKEKSDQLLEYIDGMVFMSPSPSTAHQRISGHLNAHLFNLLEDKNCEVFQAPFDIELSKDDIDENKVVIPDLSVICDKSGLNESKYIGVPDIIFEIISPSNQSHDLVTKLNLYMNYGVKEYWIINPLLNTVQIYSLNEQGQYFQKDIVKEKGMVQSDVLKDFQLKVEDIFG